MQICLITHFWAGEINKIYLEKLFKEFIWTRRRHSTVLTFNERVLLVRYLEQIIRNSLLFKFLEAIITLCLHLSQFKSINSYSKSTKLNSLLSFTLKQYKSNRRSGFLKLYTAPAQFSPFPNLINLQ